MRQICRCFWLSLFISGCVAIYTANSTHHICLAGTPGGFIRPSTRPIGVVASRYASPAYRIDMCQNSVHKMAKNIAGSLNFVGCNDIVANLATKLKTFVPDDMLNLKLPFQSLIYFSTLSIYLVDSFIFDGLFAGLFELRGNALAVNEEAYRILTSLFIHRDWSHLAMNLLSFSTIAPMVIKATGPIKALLIYILSGIIANYVTYVYHVLHEKGIPIQGEFDDGRFDPVIDISKKYYEAVRMFKEFPFPKYLFLHFKSLLRRLLYGKPKYSTLKLNPTLHSFTARGASGAIYGLHGAYMIYRWNKEGIMAIPTGFLLPNRIWEIILSSLLNSLGDNHIDTVAHVSGFIAGMLIGSVIKLYS
ncbi:hypothetical protein BmR1_04g09675 [Babesia microti strain RI]|uniref:Peptidase S54 rhomboid domain-containing protein n=1 Tax=Babesia microti (strain RI) TaxID=1133968 RepID=I7IHN1_BABMR|nr:hypothetical protein BmR1_04g09675 [Babesia microti strain RI]CCF76102.1 hypothetical protein BmR1_04g09675 [Babesia microti strain RI]|eukprot:XP_012650510.1 hypothetical protein BmR1_04g09675 [Babesia microti strain RI]